VSLKLAPGGILKSNGKLVPEGMITSFGRGIAGGYALPFASVICWDGTKPGGRIRLLGSGTSRGIRIGFDTPPPIPQHVEVINLSKSHC
jgi:hypothetical protein